MSHHEQANPLKDDDESKDVTRKLSDRTTPAGRRDAADTAHPAQHGGATHLDPAADPRHVADADRPGTQTEGPGPAKAPARSRVGPDAAGQSRPGKTKGTRRSERRRD